MAWKTLHSRSNSNGVLLQRRAAIWTIERPKTVLPRFHPKDRNWSKGHSCCVWLRIGKVMVQERSIWGIYIFGLRWDSVELRFRVWKAHLLRKKISWTLVGVQRKAKMLSQRSRSSLVFKCSHLQRPSGTYRAKGKEPQWGLRTSSVMLEQEGHKPGKKILWEGLWITVEQLETVKKALWRRWQQRTVEIDKTNAEERSIVDKTFGKKSEGRGQIKAENG